MKRGVIDIYLIGIICALALVVVGALSIVVVLNRIDRNREEIASVRASIPPVPSEPPLDAKALAPFSKRLEQTEASLVVCRARTEWLRVVLETFVPNGDRVRLPDPPPGWQRWPTVNPDD